MPNEIDITITERKPIAWITSEKTVTDPFASDAAFLVDARGVLMKEKKLLPEYLALPLITGCSSEALVPGKTVDSFEAKAALELLRLTTTSFMQTRFQIREVDVSKGYCLLVTDKNHTRVMFGFDHLDIQMQRLEQFLVYSDDSQREIETVNLLVARNIPVTFAQPASEIISELETEPETTEAPETKVETKPAASEPEIRKAKAGSPHDQESAALQSGREKIPLQSSAPAGAARRSHFSVLTRKATVMASSDLMVGLEIGTSKICVVVGEGKPDGTIKILGVGQAPSRGVRKGEIVDFETAMKCVHEAVVDAEEKSDVMIRSVYVGITGAHIQSFNNRGCVSAARRPRRDRRTGYRGCKNQRARSEHPGAERVSALDHPALSRRWAGRRAQSSRHAGTETGGRFPHHSRRAHADPKHDPLRQGIAARSRGRRLHRPSPPRRSS